MRYENRSLLTRFKVLPKVREVPKKRYRRSSLFFLTVFGSLLPRSKSVAVVSANNKSKSRTAFMLMVYVSRVAVSSISICQFVKLSSFVSCGLFQFTSNPSFVVLFTSKCVTKMSNVLQNPLHQYAIIENDNLVVILLEFIGLSMHRTYIYILCEAENNCRMKFLA